MKRYAILGRVMVLCLAAAFGNSAVLNAAEQASEIPTSAPAGNAVTANYFAVDSIELELARQTIIPCELTLAAENPVLARQAPPSVLASMNSSAANSSALPGTNSTASPGTAVTASAYYSPAPNTLNPTATSGATTIASKANATAAKTAPQSAVVPTTATTNVATAKIAAGCEQCMTSPAQCGQSCNNSCNDCCKCCLCGPPGDFWLRDEYVGWWAQGGHLPTLVATSPTGTLPATVPLYGDATYNGGYRSGNWTQGGMWFDCCHTHGIEGDYFFVGRESSPFSASCEDGDSILTRPFIDANTGLPRDELVCFPGVVVGRISVDNHNFLDGASIDMRCNVCCCCCDSPCGHHCWCDEKCSRLDVVYGFRYYGFNDNLGVREQLTSIDPTSGVPIGTQIDVRDSFTTQNNFYGLDIGFISQRYSGRWELESTLKVALGDMNQLVSINGSTVISFPGQPTTFNQGGLLALSSNIGDHVHNSFAAIPQVSLRLGYRVSENCTLLAGYTLMYFSQLARAGDQIDTTVNPNLLPPPIGGGPNRPEFAFHPSDLLLQGITLGAQINF